MPACIICKSRDASLRFPKSEADISRWKTSLGLSVYPGEHSRICDKHFKTSDIETSANGIRKKLCKGATPTPIVTVSGEKVARDHTYSVLSKPRESLSLSLSLSLSPLHINNKQFTPFKFYLMI